MPSKKKIIYFFVSLVIAIITGVLAFIVVYNLACALSPPYFINEETGEKHVTMPMGQFFIGTAAGIVIGIIVLVVGYKRFVKIKT